MLLEPAIVAALVTLLLGGLATVFRYIFNIELITEKKVDEKIQAANAERQNDFDRISEKLDNQETQLQEIRDLIMGGEYQVSDGMLEIVEMNRKDVEEHEERIEGVERVQLKIRRRQRDHSGEEPVEHSEDLDLSPSDHDDR
jgi:hypothetical protein